MTPTTPPRLLTTWVTYAPTSDGPWSEPEFTNLTDNDPCDWSGPIRVPHEGRWRRVRIVEYGARGAE